ncbi:het-domain-containing protein [Fusarium flagelliforme]|uniref:Het-domain-containing protein n=1 Tax=Fusarium flagelliforme TaxID=2675880 RepID=A0A395MTV5_9HYPO|nr:het-domain-containing protein [Fusarium flagelliforme]
MADHTHGIRYESLPKSFQDAVAVTRSIGVRYLWIDSLCIVQDDRLDWEIESSKMASIYSNAYLVLAASQATDSSEGFIDRKDVGLKSTMQLDPRNSVKMARMKNPDSTTSEIYSRHMSTDPTMGKSRHRWKITSSPLNQRGWVLQENILARRIVHFTESEMIWECVECLRCECMEVEADKSEATLWTEFSMVRNSRITGPTRESVQTVNMLYEQWRKLIGFYGRLILTKDSDRLPALSGLAKLCQSQGAGKYLAGLWENDLLKSLVWHIHTDEPVKRWDVYMAPSWSPFSVGYIKRWDGLIEAGCWYCYDEVYHERWGEPQAKILEAHCDPAGMDPTGAVKDGFLVLRGPMRKDDPDEEDHSWMVSDSDNLWEWNVWKYVSWDRPTEQVEHSEILFFLLWADFNMGYIRALCLIPVENAPGTYTRIGIVDSHFEDKGLGDFFKDTEEGEVRII